MARAAVLGGAVVGPEEILKEIHGFVRSAGPCMSPFNAWVFLKGLETLGLRMKAHSENALQLAQWLEQQPGIARVHYAGLDSHPQKALAERQQKAFGAVIAIEVEDSDGRRDRQAAWRFIDATRLLSITANLGDVKSTVTHPATTTHGRVAEEEKQRSGISENLIRIAVGWKTSAISRTIWGSASKRSASNNSLKRVAKKGVLCRLWIKRWPRWAACYWGNRSN